MIKDHCNETELNRCDELKGGGVAMGALVIGGMLVTGPASTDHWGLKPCLDGEKLGSQEDKHAEYR